jgi:hypothetical protein
MISGLQPLEKKLPACFVELALNRAFVELIHGLGDGEMRHALQMQLRNRPIGNETILG